MQDFMERPIVPRVPVLRRITWGTLIFGALGSWGLSMAHVPMGIAVMSGVMFAIAGAFSEPGEGCSCVARCIYCDGEMAEALICPNEACRPARFADEREDEDSPYGLTA